MLTHDDMQKLIEISGDSEELIHEVSKLSESDAKLALVMAMLSWHKGNEVNREILKNHMKNE